MPLSLHGPPIEQRRAVLCKPARGDVALLDHRLGSGPAAKTPDHAMEANPRRLDGASGTLLDPLGMRVSERYWAMVTWINVLETKHSVSPEKRFWCRQLTGRGNVAATDVPTGRIKSNTERRGLLLDFYTFGNAQPVGFWIMYEVFRSHQNLRCFTEPICLWACDKEEIPAANRARHICRPPKLRSVGQHRRSKRLKELADTERTALRIVLRPTLTGLTRFNSNAG